MRIALLDDDPALITQLLTTLKSPIVPDEHNSCVTYSHGETLRRALRRETFDVLVLDWNLPDLDGTALLHWMRHERNDHTPVIMLSSRASERDVAEALKSGADDYVIKPFRPLELRARIDRLVNRRPKSQQGGSAQVLLSDWTFDSSSNRILWQGDDSHATPPDEVQLTEREFRLAQLLFQHLGQAVSRNYLLERSGYESEESPTRTLDSHIYRLRKKLKLDGQRTVKLLTLYGHGYRLMPSQSEKGLDAPKETSPMGELLRDVGKGEGFLREDGEAPQVNDRKLSN